MVNYIIPAKANELVKRLVQILIGPFSKYQTHQDTNELLALLQERKAAIEDVIKIALEFKKNIILGVRAYQVIDIEPGTPFDKRMMEDDGAGVGQVPGGTPESARVKLCLQVFFSFTILKPTARRRLKRDQIGVRRSLSAVYQSEDTQAMGQTHQEWSSVRRSSFYSRPINFNT